MSDPIIPRKWMLRASNHHNVFVWGARERSVHTIMKALLWALYVPDYPHIAVEVRIGDRYKPDLVAYESDEIAPSGIHTIKEEPLFWGEAGAVGRDKIYNIVRKYRNTHFVIAKWETSLTSHEKMIRKALKGVNRTAPFDLINFDKNSHKKFIDDEGNITIHHDDIEWIRLSKT